MAQSSPGERSACAPQSKTTTVMLAEFMLHQLKPLLQDLRKRYFAKGFAE
jgi:hypothetical protein